MQSVALQDATVDVAGDFLSIGLAIGPSPCTVRESLLCV